ncbi:MAG: cupin domain-containing protein [candidate division KSB1 bacterium]|nr:cupin domain-containing protein [candidate division KSB1 bacterium]
MKEETPLGAVSLAASVSYQENSIVSQTLLKRSSGTLTLFAFDKGQALSEHTAPFDAVVQVIDGKAQIIIAGKPYLVSAGEYIIMPANVPHAVNAVERFKMLLTMLRSAE